jgi:hypothetical protein
MCPARFSALPKIRTARCRARNAAAAHQSESVSVTRRTSSADPNDVLRPLQTWLAQQGLRRSAAPTCGGAGLQSIAARYVWSAPPATRSGRFPIASRWRCGWSNRSPASAAASSAPRRSRATEPVARSAASTRRCAGTAARTAARRGCARHARITRARRNSPRYGSADDLVGTRPQLTPQSADLDVSVPSPSRSSCAG